MAVTVFETAVPFHATAAAAENGVDGGIGKEVVVDDGGSGGSGGQAVLLQETDHGGDDDRPERDDVWNMIQSQKPVATPAPAAAAPYVHPLVRRSSSLLSQKSLEICTESLGSETGSDGFSDADGATDRSCPASDSDSDEVAADQEVAAAAAARASESPSPPRAFPPPLPSLARRSTVCGAVQMRKDRRDGRLVVKAVPMPSTTLFRAQRSGGRLLLSFADTAAPASDDDENQDQEETEEKQADELDDEEEVEVVDRGTIVEVKVSTQPQARSNGSGPRVHRSSLVINKFVNAEPAIAASDIIDTVPATAGAATAPNNPPRRPTGSTTTTAAAALVAASALSATSAPSCGDGESKLLMTACRRRRSKEELMNHMRRCGQLSGKLFIFESRIATSS
uniref:FAF domain-containing protein n=1 Tax=Leersia perrieri TaxID=77586 RepID=A0A0D9VS61_9ORYZ